MSERITVRDVRTAFATFAQLAGQAGLDTTGWTLQEGNQWQAYRLYVASPDGYRQMATHPMADYIGSTAREAHAWLQASVQTMRPLVELNQRTTA